MKFRRSWLARNGAAMKKVTAVGSADGIDTRRPGPSGSNSGATASGMRLEK